MNMRVFEFGERIWWKQPSKGPQHDTKGNMGPRQFPGIFLGWNKVSNTYRVLDENGHIIKARSAQARPYDEKWRPEQLAEIDISGLEIGRVGIGDIGRKHIGSVTANTQCVIMYTQCLIKKLLHQPLRI